MQQTEHYQLNQWDPSDRILREDFNADNAKLDAALAGKGGKLELIRHISFEGYSYRSGSLGLLVNDWNDWSSVYVLFNPHISGYADGDEYKCGVGGVSGSKLFYTMPKAAPVFIALYPLHDATQPVTGYFVGGDMARVFLEDFSFETLHDEISYNITSAAGTVLQGPTLTVLGRR